MILWIGLNPPLKVIKMEGFYRINPKDVEETIKIHKILMLKEYIGINHSVTDHLCDVVNQFINTLECFNPKELEKLINIANTLAKKIHEYVNGFLDTELKDSDDVYRYATVLIALTGVLKAYELFLGSRLENGLYELLMQLGAVKVEDLQKEECDKDENN